MTKKKFDREWAQLATEVNNLTKDLFEALDDRLADVHDCNKSGAYDRAMTDIRIAHKAIITALHQLTTLL